MTPREGSSGSVPLSADDADGRGSCAPIEETAADELDCLYRFAVARLGGGSRMAEDVVQQALVIALAHASPPGEAGRQRAWLRGIVRNVIRRDARSARRGREAVLRLVSGGSEADGVNLAGGQAIHDERRAGTVRALLLAVTALNRADQDLFYAVYREGRSHASVAAELGTTVKGVEARLYRMRSRLRAALASGEEDSGVGDSSGEGAA